MAAWWWCFIKQQKDVSLELPSFRNVSIKTYLLGGVTRVPDLKLALALSCETNADKLIFRPEECQLARPRTFMHHWNCCGHSLGRDGGLSISTRERERERDDSSIKHAPHATSATTL